MTSPSLSDILLLVRKNVSYTGLSPGAIEEMTLGERVCYNAGWQDALNKVEAILKVLGVEIDSV